MPEADAEHRHVPLGDARGSRRARTSIAAGSPGPFERNTPSGLSSSTSSAGVVGGHDRHAAAVLVEQAQDVALDAEVVRDDVMRRLRVAPRVRARAS